MLAGRVSALFLERGRLEARGHALVFVEKDGLTEIPSALAAVLFLEPGTSVTHQAVMLCADSGTLLVWVGEAGIRVYSAGLPGGAVGAHLIQQARVVSDPLLRLKAARAIFSMMFDEPAPKVRDIDQLRGHEGIRVRNIYSDLAKRFQVSWEGRQHDGGQPIDIAIGTATSMLYGVTEAAIFALGYSPSLGLIHTGDRRSFVFDVADTVKFKTVVPEALSIVASGEPDIRNATRRRCRDLFRSHQTIASIALNIERLFAE